MISFMISVVPPEMDWTRLSHRSRNRAGDSELALPWSARAAAFARYDLGRSQALTTTA